MRGKRCLALVGGQSIWMIGILALVVARLQAADDRSKLSIPDGFQTFPLRHGQLFVPTHYQPRNERVDFLVHFHGHPPVVCSNLLASGRSALLIVVNFPGLSSAYAEPFGDHRLLRMLLDEALSQVAQLWGAPVRIDRLAISSFSAGYGAVREILKQPVADRITDLLLLDSLYAGYVAGEGGRQPDPAHLEHFMTFARRAARGEVRLILTHSQLIPGAYASTRETADVLLRAAGAVRTPATQVDNSGLALESVSDRGGFHLRSYVGSTGEDHMEHLRRMANALRMGSLPQLRGAGEGPAASRP